MTPLHHDSMSHEADESKSRILRSLQKYGLVVLSNHGIHAKDLQTNREIFMNEIFSMSNEEKSNISMQEAYGRGYIGVGRESGLADIYEPKEGYSYGHDWPSEEGSPENDLQRSNIWPSSFHDSSRRHLELYYYRNVHIASIIQGILLDDMKIPQSNILDGGGTISIMRVFHYFQSDRINCLGSSPHTDWGMLTIISQNDIGGLQYYRDDKWHDVVASKDDLIINAGDYLSYISEGRYHSPIHRVLCPSASDRLSFVFFYYPGYKSSFDISNNSKGSDIDPNDPSSSSMSYNSMFDGSISSEEGPKLFGDYIMEKWKGVQRSDSTYQHSLVQYSNNSMEHYIRNSSR